MSFDRGYYILDDDGRPVQVHDVLTWAMWIEANERQIGCTAVGEATVSTVFLSLDQNWRREGPPLLFETMVFGGKLNEKMQRYTTRDEALAGHDAMVKRVSETLH